MTTPRATRPTTTLERTYPAPITDVWELWTTKEGIEAWWGPDGFTVTVLALELRPGGDLRYAMTATAAPMIAFMKQHGMPVSTETRFTFTEVDPPHRLAYTNHVDFVPGVAAYEAAGQVELTATPTGTRVRVTLEAMHDATWTQRATMGWEGQLAKLAAVLAARVTADA
jgi:uncharacterized protein YndB with AHSA1/START domain